MAAQIHNFQILSHLRVFYFSFQSICGALGDASRSTRCSAEHSLGISGLDAPHLHLWCHVHYGDYGLKTENVVCICALS